MYANVHLEVCVLALCGETALEVAQRLLLREQLLAFLRNLALDLDLDLAKLLLLATELLLLETHALGGEVLGQDGRVLLGVDRPRELLGTVRLVKDVVGEGLELSQMSVEKCAPQAAEVGVLGVVDLDDAPRIDACTDELAVNFNLVLGTDNGKRHEGTELAVIGDGVFVVLLDVVREVVNRNIVVLDILHDALLEALQLLGCQRVGLANDGDDVDTWREATHEFNIDLAQGMAGRRDEVEKGVDTVVAEARVTLDAALLSKDMVVFALEVAENFLETVGERRLSGSAVETRREFIREQTYANSLSMLSPKPGVSTMVSAMRTPSSSSSEDRQSAWQRVRKRGSLTDVDGLDADALLNVGLLRVVRVLVLEHAALAQRVDERCPSGARRACTRPPPSAHAGTLHSCPDSPTTMTVN